MAKEHSLYRIVDETGQLLYVGISVDPGKRLAQHRSDKPWWSEAVTVHIQPMPNRQAALDAEREAIKNERPLYNHVHNDRGVLTDPSVAELRYALHVLVRQLPIDLVYQIWLEMAADGATGGPMDDKVICDLAVRLAEHLGRKFIHETAPDLEAELLKDWGDGETAWAEVTGDLQMFFRKQLNDTETGEN